MAGKLSFKKGPFAKLPSSFSEGTIYITTDRHEMYVDINSGSRIKISDISIVASKADLPKTKDQVTTKFYFVDKDNILVDKWILDRHNQLETDTDSFTLSDSHTSTHMHTTSNGNTGN